MIDLFTPDNLDIVNAEIKELTDKLNYYNQQYHTYDNSIISDIEYDKLYHKLLQLEAKYPQLKQSNSPSNKIGGELLDGFKSVAHTVPMLSLGNIFCIAENKNPYIEVELFVNKIAKELDTNPEQIEFVVSPKYDGVAVSLIYINGIFSQGLTRGDGFSGEDITHNIKTIANLPLQLQDTAVGITEIRGEVIITTQDFIKLNQIQQQNNHKIYANPRNLAAGSLRLLDSSMTSARPLRFYAYALVRSPHNFTTFQAELNYIKSNNITISDLCNTAIGSSGLINYYTKMLQTRSSIEFNIDGLVYKINNIQAQKTLGVLSRQPKFAIAHKFPAEEKVTQLMAIDFQVGRTGAITPVARLQPTIVDGVLVSNVTLHNEGEIKRKGIMIGDYVVVRRAGDVIPEIARVEIAMRNITQVVAFQMLVHCPVCGSNLEKDEDDAVWRCVAGIYCKAQKVQAITHFASRLAMNIDGLGEKIVTQLVENNLVNTIDDLFEIQAEQLLPLEGFATKSAAKLIDSINQSKTTTLNRFIYALGIRHIGETSAKTLARKYQTLENFLSTTQEELLSIRDIGAVVAPTVHNFLQEPHNQTIIQQLLAHGITILVNINNSIANDFFTNKVFVITGTFANYSREQIKQIIDDNNGKVSSSVSKKTNYLIMGSDAGSKLTRAQELGVELIDETQLIDILKS